MCNNMVKFLVTVGNAILCPLGILAIILWVGGALDLPVFNWNGLGVATSEFGPCVYYYTLGQTWGVILLIISLCRSTLHTHRLIEEMEDEAARKAA